MRMLVTKLVCQEEMKGHQSEPMDRAEVDRLFGTGWWRPVPLFAVRQNNNRLIADGRRGGHGYTYDQESLLLPNVDFVAFACAGCDPEEKGHSDVATHHHSLRCLSLSLCNCEGDGFWSKFGLSMPFAGSPLLRWHWNDASVPSWAWHMLMISSQRRWCSSSSHHAHFWLVPQTCLESSSCEQKTKWPSSQESCFRCTCLPGGSWQQSHRHLNLTHGSCTSAQAAKLRG